MIESWEIRKTAEQVASGFAVMLRAEARGASDDHIAHLMRVVTKLEDKLMALRQAARQAS